MSTLPAITTGDVFIKTEEDCDSSPVFAQGIADITLLLIGWGSRDEESELEEIYATYTVGPAGNRTSYYYWGPPGEEGRSSYKKVSRWAKGFWKNQFPGLGINERRGGRAGRLYNILTHAETIEDAMTTAFDPSTNTHKRLGGRKRRFSEVRRDDEEEEEEEELEQELENEVDSEKRSATIVGATSDGKAKGARLSSSISKVSGQNIAHLSSLPATSSTASAKKKDQDQFSLTKSHHDREGKIQFVNCNYNGTGDCKMLLVGVGRKTDGGTLRAVRIYACPTHDGKNIMFYWAPQNNVTRATYSDVEQWYQSLWCCQVDSTQLDPKQARTVRIHNLFNNAETIESALSTRVNDISHQLTNRELTPGSSRASQDFKASPLSTIATSQDSATTAELSDQSATNDSVTTAHSSKAAAMMTQSQAIAIYFEAQKTKCEPETLQQALSIILTQPPPLKLVRAAVLWASMQKDTRAFSDCPPYARWAKANAIDLKNDILEEVDLVLG